MDDWQVGDLALCVHDGDWFGQNVSGVFGGPNAGSISLVSEVRRWRRNTYLIFSKCAEHCYGSDCFRKVTPPEADAFDREVIEQMSGAPVGEPVA